MDKNELIKQLNDNLKVTNIESIINIILEFLNDKQIDNSKASLFIKTIISNPLFTVNDTLSKCYLKSVEYLTIKHNIRIITKENQIIYYY